MKRSAERGFTLVEIMIVVAIIALLAAIAIPSVLRSRTSANEAASVGNLHALVTSLETYRSTTNAYPDAWQADMYGANCTVGTAPDPDFGLPSFCVDISTEQTVQGYDYVYTASPANCDNGAGGICSQYNILATPGTLGRTGTRSFYVDESGTVRHCTGTGAAATMADDTTIDRPPQDCD